MTRSSGFIFLLTRLLRGATCKHSACLLDDPISTHTPLARRDPPECILPVHPGYFYSHASCEARQRIDCIGGENYLISTHTPHAGRDEYPTGAGVQCFRFLLTRPMRGATRSVLRKCVWDGISTHTPHAGRDLVKVKSGNGSFISTHTPHAGRDFLFQQVFLQSPISTHTPHAGRDEKSTGDLRGKFNFYSHAPCGARPNHLEN